MISKIRSFKAERGYSLLEGKIRIVYLLSEREKYSVEEISKIMGVSSKTINKYKDRAKELLEEREEEKSI